MKQIPILFSTPMVKAILEGRKTQTRRVVKSRSYITDVVNGVPYEMTEDDSQPIRCPYGQPGDKEWQTGMPPKDGYYFVKDEFEEKPVYLRVFPKGLDDIKEPFITWGWNEQDDPESLHSDGGPTPETIKWKRPGDVLWVRETWCETIDHDEPGPGYAYKADGYVDGETKWRPSIHMPREACRLFLRVKSVRAELLQDITEEDAIAEGAEKVWQDTNGIFWHPASESIRSIGEYGDYITGFKSIWVTINGPESWDANPWVWVVEFEIMKGGKP